MSESCWTSKSSASTVQILLYCVLLLRSSISVWHVRLIFLFLFLSYTVVIVSPNTESVKKVRKFQRKFAALLAVKQQNAPIPSTVEYAAFLRTDGDHSFVKGAHLELLGEFLCSLCGRFFPMLCVFRPRCCFLCFSFLCW